MKNLSKKNKIILIAVALVIIISIIVILLVSGKNKTETDTNNDATQVVEKVEEEKETTKQGKVDVVNLESNSRPYAVVINNTPVAVKVQEGLNKAYMVYEIPTEGNTSRLMALYKDIEEDLVIGTIRSARHNFIDYALESDAIFCCYGWSIYAQNDLKSGIIDYYQGLFGGPYYRNNPENLASEHTAYTSMKKLLDYTKTQGVRTTSKDSIVLNYDVEDVYLENVNNVIKANTITIPYGAAPQITSFKYDENTKMYTRYENGVKCVDHNTKDAVTTKNIISIKVDYNMCDNDYYWNLKTIGKGEGYYITNGYAVPITWSKTSRADKTKYMYKEGTIIDGKDVGGQEISVSDGRTWIEIQTTKQKTTIE